MWKTPPRKPEVKKCRPGFRNPWASLPYGANTCSSTAQHHGTWISCGIWGWGCRRPSCSYRDECGKHPRASQKSRSAAPRFWNPWASLPFVGANTAGRTSRNGSRQGSPSKQYARAHGGVWRSGCGRAPHRGCNCSRSSFTCSVSCRAPYSGGWLPYSGAITWAKWGASCRPPCPGALFRANYAMAEHPVQAPSSEPHEAPAANLPVQAPSYEPIEALHMAAESHRPGSGGIAERQKNNPEVAQEAVRTPLVHVRTETTGLGPPRGEGSCQEAAPGGKESLELPGRAPAADTPGALGPSAPGTPRVWSLSPVHYTLGCRLGQRPHGGCRHAVYAYGPLAFGLPISSDNNAPHLDCIPVFASLHPLSSTSRV